MCCQTHSERDQLADLKHEEYELAPSHHFRCQCEFGQPCQRTGKIMMGISTGQTGFMCEWCAGTEHESACIDVDRELAAMASRYAPKMPLRYAERYRMERYAKMTAREYWRGVNPNPNLVIYDEIKEWKIDTP